MRKFDYKINRGTPFCELPRHFHYEPYRKLNPIDGFKYFFKIRDVEYTFYGVIARDSFYKQCKYGKIINVVRRYDPSNEDKNFSYSWDVYYYTNITKKSRNMWYHIYKAKTLQEALACVNTVEKVNNLRKLKKYYNEIYL